MTWSHDEKLVAAVDQLKADFGSAALPIAVSRLLALQEKYDALRADWERMLDASDGPQVADDLTEALNEGEP